MSSRNYRPLFVVTGLTIVSFALASGCAESDLVVGNRVDDAPPPSFTDPDAGPDARPLAPTNLCIATTCPAPWGSCGDGYACNTNLSSDSENCGTCGHVCPARFGYLNMSSTCVNGACEPLCGKTLVWGGFENFADCNKILEDGCEISISTDSNNCGACGNKCAEGVRCIDGKCGCNPGEMDCNGQCVDVRNNDQNCGACDNACQPPTDAGAQPANTVYGCVDRKCGQLKCDDTWGPRWADCDNNKETNGCEVYIGSELAEIDPNNCGKCGRKCTADQICWDVTGDGLPECLCDKPQETRCGSIEGYDLGCFDLLNDIDNCGTCAHKCWAVADHATAACRKGLCEIECAPGWGDCDGEPGNGCESNLKSSDGNCGACGNRCDTQAGQPCVDGTCAMTECDGGKGPQ